ncbi:MAG: M20/M25/M40 family metallo-hydrolase [Saprospiraceae bacterium]|nr:M20/M25/M40 family metallo-hydrolase [Saprospiraceae bacterium]
MKRTRTLFLTCLLAAWGSSLVGQTPGVADLLNAIRLDTLHSLLRQLTGEEAVMVNDNIATIHSRYFTEPGNELAFQFIKEKMEGYGWDVEVFPFGTGNGKNLICRLPSSTGQAKEVMLGAHYDNMPPGADAPGADDNATGCSALLEVARVLANEDFPFSMTLAFWDEEELGLIGSTQYANYLLANDLALAAYLNLDMLGWDGNGDNQVEVQLRPEAMSAQLASKAVWADSIFDIGLEVVVKLPGVANSDHGPFWANGFTAISLSESYFTDFNPHYHSITDELVHINLPYFEKLTKLALAIFLEFGYEITGATPTVFMPEFQGKLQVFPNPASGISVVFFEGEMKGLNWRLVSGVSGQIALEGSTDLPTFNLDLTGLPAGVYHLICWNENAVMGHQKILKH